MSGVFMSLIRKIKCSLGLHYAKFLPDPKKKGFSYVGCPHCKKDIGAVGLMEACDPDLPWYEWLWDRLMFFKFKMKLKILKSMISKR
jgi:hypothetical protein